MRLVDFDDAAKQLPPVYDAVQRVTPGMYERSETWWRNRQLVDPEDFRFGGSPKHIAVLEVDGEPQAYAIYRLHVAFGDLGPETKLRTIEVIATTPAATASIWRYLLDVDWTKTVSAGLQPVDHPLCACSSPARVSRSRRSRTGSGCGSSTWKRRSPGGATRARAQSSWTSATGSARGTRAAGGWRAGRRSGPVTDADIALDVSDLGSVYLGGFTFRDLQRAGRLDELTEGAVYLADAIFRTEGLPWCPEIF